MQPSNCHINRTFLWHADEEASTDLFNILWATWFSQNCMLHEGKLMSFQHFLARASIQKLKRQQAEQVQTQTPLISWKRPPLQCIKINFDASAHNNQGTGMGLVVARDHEKLVLGAATIMVTVVYMNQGLQKLYATSGRFKWQASSIL